MASYQSVLATFNRGIVSQLALARTDLERARLSADMQTNWMPRSLGPMSLRPGLGYIGNTYNHAKAQHIPFVFAADDTALIEVTDGQLRVRIDDEIISRASVSTAVVNGTFGSNLNDWTDADETGAASAWATGGYMSLIGTRFNAAIRRQTLTVAGPDQGVEHALRIVVERGPVLFRLGSSSGGDEYINETPLGTGTHSLAFTPTGASVYVQFANRNQRAVLVDSIAVEGVGEVSLPAPWDEADLPLLRWDQSNDVVFVACEGYQQRRIERRAARSWSIIKYEPLDGPFRLENVSSIRLTPSAITGDVTLTASGPVFRSDHVGALFRIRSIGQRVEIDVNGENQFSNEIKVTGVGASRRFYWTVTGTWTATVTIQRSVGTPDAWVDWFQFTANQSDFQNDDLDNEIVYYRIGVKTGDFGSGTVDAVLTFGGGSIRGVVRINAYSSQTSVTAGVIEDLGGTDGSEIWEEGAWSDFRGWPSAVAFYEGRLGWFGRAGVWLSVSDTVDSYDSSVEGDSAPISRTIRYGSADAVAWAQAAQRLLVGTAGAELSIRSTSFDEVLTNGNYNIKPASTQGALREVAAILMDGSVVFVQASGVRIFELEMGGNGLDYTPIDLTTLVPEVGEPEIVAMAIQRQPDTRIHCVRSDGKVAIAVIDKLEKVLAWVLFETDGLVEGVVRLPGSLEDRVYYVVKRTINGNTVRHLEKWALENECDPFKTDAVRLADSHVAYSNVGGSILGGLSHLEGETVICWADGAALGEFTVSGGQIDVVVTVTDAVVGLPYTAVFKSAKLATAFRDGSTTLNWRKTFKKLGLIARNMHHDAITYGTDADHLFPLPRIENGKPVPEGTIWETYDHDFLQVDNEWTTDSRLYIKAEAPYPVTILGLTATVDANAP